MADYSISLGALISPEGLQRVRSQIETIEKNPIKLQIDSSLVDSRIKGIKQELSNLGNKSGLKLDTASLEASLDRVAIDIKEIRTAFGTLDSKSGMGNLLTSINQISVALDNASKQFVELNAQLNSLAGKNFGVNIGLNMGGGNAVSRNAAYGSMVRSQVLPQLKQQADALGSYFKNYYKSVDDISAIMKLAGSVDFKLGGQIQDLYIPMTGYTSKGTKASLAAQIDAYRQYINIVTKAASIRGIDISHITSGFSQTAESLVKEAHDIQSGATEMENSFERLKGIFGSGLDTERLSTQLDSIVADLNEIKTAIQNLSSNNTLDGLTQSFNNLSASLEKLVGNATQAQNALNNGLNTSATSAGTQKAIQEQNQLAQTTEQTANVVSQSGQKVQQAFTQMASAGNLDPLQLQDDISEADKFAAALSRLKSIQGNIGKIEVGKMSTSKSVQELKVLETQLETLSVEYNETVAEINGMGGVSATQLQTFQNQIATTKIKIEQLKASISSGIKGNFGNYENQLLSLEGRIGKLATKTPELQMNLERVRQALTTLKSADGTENLIAKNQQYLSVLKQVTAEVTRLEIAERNSNSNVALQQQKQALTLKMSNWLRDNSAAAKEFGGEIRNLQVQLQNCGNTAGVQQVGRQFDIVTAKAKEAGVTAMTFGDRLKKQFAQYSSYISVYSLFMYATMAMRSMFEQVKSIDSAMTELKKVTDETADSYSRFLTNAATRSKEIGTTIDGLVSSTADFARLGYNFKDAQGLAEVANIYAVVGDEIEGVEQATESLISTMAAFKDSTVDMSNSDFAMSIIDKFNEIKFYLSPYTVMYM